MRTRTLAPWCLALLLIFVAGLGRAEEPKPAAEGKKAEAPAAPEEKSSITHHSFTAGGKKLDYTATAANLLLRDEEGKVKASVFLVAYTLDGVKDPASRPVTFSFNGGPGAAAVWVHLGAFGPQRVAMDDEGGPLPPPGRLVDNEDSLLPESDLVFIDPVSTGYSRPAPGEDPDQFHGIEEDVRTVGEVIRLWVSRHQRWASPKFIAGESYGTTRAAGLATYLQERVGMYLNGLVLISSVLNWQNQEFAVGNDVPYLIHLPSYTATAWYHHKLAPELAGDLETTLAQAEAFALGDYALALHQGDQLPAARRQEIARQLARFTGLGADFVERANLRIDLQRFLKELLRGEGKTVGRLDSRFTGFDRDSAGEEPEYDPAMTVADIGYVTLMNDYLRRELGYETDLPYEALSPKVWPWKFGDGAGYPNLAENLREAITRNPALQVLIASGYYDFATPYFDAQYTVAHMALVPSLRGNVSIEHYRAGHMMYIRRADHHKLHADVARLIARATQR